MLEHNRVFQSFSVAQQKISPLEPIDYFLAEQMVALLPSDNNNLFAHLMVVLSQYLRDGHTCLPIENIANKVFGLASDEDVITHHGYQFPDAHIINELLESLAISSENEHPIVYWQRSLYLRRYFDFEQQVALYVTQQNSDITKNNIEEIADVVKQLFGEPLAQSEAIDWQKVAVANAINKPFSIIAGGPGTGKTYTVTKLLAALVMLNKDEHPLNMALVAPTGKAAQRLSESIVNALNGFKGQIPDDVLAKIPTDTQTIHRLLGVIPNNPNFRHHRDNPLTIDVLLIDEVSMVDVAMMSRIIRALPPQCRVILLGDADQLPSVSAGSVLADLAIRPHQGFSNENSQYIRVTTQCQVDKVKRGANANGDNVTFLQKSRRFDSDGGIGRIAAAVIASLVNESWQILNQQPQDTEVELLPIPLNDWLPDLIEQYYLPLFSAQTIQQAFNLLGKFRVLCATRQGEQGVEYVNQQVHHYLLSKNLIGQRDKYYQSQPIMITENNYPLGLYNGDIGILWPNESGQLMAAFEGEQHSIKWVMPSRLPLFETVYAMTIHKTQGSEFSHVAMVLPVQQDNRLLSRELLYTGITRAKHKLSISCSHNVWRHGVETSVNRFSGLPDLIANLKHNI